MEDIKTNFDKIMEKFNDSITNSNPKKIMNFTDSMENSFELSVPKKRKLSLEKNELITNKLNLDESFTNTTKNSSQESLNSSICQSPWEQRRMKADLLEAKGRISKLKNEIERQNKLRSELEILYSSQVSELKKQCEFSSNKVIDVEKHLTVLRKRENSAKSELVKVKNQLNQQKEYFENTIYSLQRVKVQLEENLRSEQNRLTTELNEYRRRTDKLQMDLKHTTEELNNLRNQQEELKDKGAAFDEIHAELEEERQQHEIAKGKIKTLEYEIGSYNEWKDISKSSQSRLANMPNLESEILRLQKDNKNLRDTIGDKLLLEEQVHDLKSRLERSERATTDLSSMKTQIKSLEHELESWMSVAKDHVLPNIPVNPVTLRARIELILQKDLILASDKGNSKYEKNAVVTQVQELTAQNELCNKNLNDLKKILKERENILLRVKKRLVMVAKERDCYKQLVDNYEKDLTITNAIADALNPDSQLRSRLELLEKTLIGYKTMCSNLEKELEEVRQYPEIQVESTPIENYDRLKKDIEALRVENDRLRRRKEELELEMEHRCLKGDFNVDKVRVLHMKFNPAAEAYEASSLETEKLQAEIERLKRRIRKLESDNEEITSKFNETSNMTFNIKEMNAIRAKLESTENKMQHMKEVYKSANLEFREVCYMLFGYRIDRVNNKNFRISSMYAENQDEYLNFRLNESGVLDMLETNYSISLNDMMQIHLTTHKSLPTFLAALTIELFNRTTIVAQIEI